MEMGELLNREYNILHYMSCIPQKMISLSHCDNVTEFVLHDLCCQKCFNLKKAAYFVDNPDFDCFKGVVGFLREEAYKDSEAIWGSPVDFTQHMKTAAFNQQVRNVCEHSLKNTHITDHDIAGAIAKNLGFHDYKTYSWPLRHDNHGLLIVEQDEQFSPTMENHLKNGMTLLSFCPIF